MAEDRKLKELTDLYNMKGVKKMRISEKLIERLKREKILEENVEYGFRTLHTGHGQKSHGAYSWVIAKKSGRHNIDVVGSQYPVNELIKSSGFVTRVVYGIIEIDPWIGLDDFYEGECY